ncbi:hypothetical protein IGW68_06090 [Shewanella benthica]|uniref:hypothetical protein n=1 Tax=Shewanella benthica TaxID=43661 RepID=UPI0018798EDC|nr:hypothetical protein [Shewanella benthica]MBE7214729.1 hypothetical protein [Shewanella benthica]
MQRINLLIIISLLTLVPLLETLSSSTLFGLQWSSPLFMDDLRDALVIIKLGGVFLALYLLITNHSKIRDVFAIKWRFNAFLTTHYLLALLQVPFLLLGLLFVVAEPKNDQFHIEKQFTNYTIYARTVDPGAIGKAYHYFYVKCPKPLGFYQLHLIKKIDWLGEFKLKINQNKLVIRSRNNVRSSTNRLDLSKVKPCR